MKHLLAIVLLGVGCGGSSGGGGSATVVPPPPPPPLTATLEIVPGAVDLDLDGPTSAVLSVLKKYSDGSHEAVGVTWTATNPEAVELAGNFGASMTVNAIGIGTAQVTATVDGLVAHATVTVGWEIPAEVGTIYGVSGNGPSVYGPLPGPSIIRYNGDASGTPDILVTDEALWSSYGTALARDRSALYVLAWTELRRLDLATNAWTTLATADLFMDIEGLDTDADGRLFGHSTGFQTLYEFDRTTGAVVNSWTYADPLVRVMTFQMGIDGAAYYFSYMSGVWRHDLATGAVAIYHTAGGWSNNSGIAMDREGTLYTSDLFGPSVIQSRDLNGDGDADDVDESTIFADIAFLWEGWVMVDDMAIAPGGTLLINAVGLDGGYSPDAVTGLYWARDFDRSGTTTDDLDGLVRLNPQYVDTYDMDKISAVR